MELDQPEVSLSWVSSISDQGDGMVHHHVAVVVASVEDPTVVGAPVGGSHGGGEGALSGKMVHESGGIIVGKSLEGQSLNGSHAAAGASTLEWVGDTADKVLGAQLDQIVSHVVDLSIGSQDGGSSKSPAGPTGSLVPHRGDDSLP